MSDHTVVVIGAGVAGLGAAYTLKRRGLAPILLEASDRVGGRVIGDRVSGFSVDGGAEFFCPSYDVVFSICEELGLPLVRTQMKLGWYMGGRWVLSTPGLSPGTILRNIPAYKVLGFLSSGSMKLFREICRQSEYLSFAGDSRMAELDGEETFGDYLGRIGAPRSLRMTLFALLGMTMGHVEVANQAYMRTYLAETLMKANRLWAPQQGVHTLAEVLADACSDAVRVSTPARRVIVRDGAATGVAVDDGEIDADAVVCAVPATKVPAIVPDLPERVRGTLSDVTYSSGCRVVIGLDRHPLPPGWYGALYPEDDSPMLSDRSVALPRSVPAGKGVLNMLAGRDRALELIPLDDEEMKRQMLSDARRNPPPGSALPDDDEGLFVRAYRWEQAVCMPSPGMFNALSNIKDLISNSVKNLFLAGDYMRVPSVNGALASGVGAAEEAARMLGAPAG